MPEPKRRRPLTEIYSDLIKLPADKFTVREIMVLNDMNGRLSSYMGPSIFLDDLAERLGVKIYA